MHGFFDETGCGVCTPLLRGMGEIFRNSKIPQISSEPHAKDDYKMTEERR